MMMHSIFAEAAMAHQYSFTSFVMINDGFSSAFWMHFSMFAPTSPDRPKALGWSSHFLKIIIKIRLQRWAQERVPKKMCKVYKLGNYLKTCAGTEKFLAYPVFMTIWPYSKARRDDSRTLLKFESFKIGCCRELWYVTYPPLYPP